ncbi:MAG: 2-phospho-L-lactate transferase CofD family protein, partial [Anaerolineae bacterium]
DRDLATHLLRTSWLASGATPTEVTRRLARALTVAPTVLPMTDSAACATSIATADGELPFQEWFVHRRCEPPAINVRYGREAGGVPAAPTDAVLSAIADADLVVVCPSNPYLSIWPILALDGMRESLAAGPAPVVAISPVIGGRAVKGPTARMLRDFAGEASSVAVARLYNDFLDGIVIDATDEGDAAAIEELGIAVAVTGTLMTDDDARARVARRALDLGADIARRSDGVGEA